MNPPSLNRPCPHCGSVLPDDVPEPHCPRCLMAQIIEPTQAGESVTPMPSLSPDELASHFPHLEILECLGRGGMGVVYKARQKSLNRLVALKLLAPERADDPQFAARFEKEAQALAALNHPNIVGVYDFGVAQTLQSVAPIYFLLMEFVDGVNLRQLLQTKRLTPKEALGIVPPVCGALQCAHDHGIVHRDIKPENLLIDRSGVVKIADFGIAKIIDRETDTLVCPSSEQTSCEAAERMSVSLPHGTPDYAAPEQADGLADHRADIYSLGVVLYEMLTGERPAETITPPSKRVQVDIRIDEIVLKALEKQPEMRFATADEMCSQLKRATNSPLQAESNTARSGFRGRVILAACLMIASGVGVAVYLRQPQRVSISAAKSYPAAEASVPAVSAITPEVARIEMPESQTSLAFGIGKAEESRVIVHRCGASSKPIDIRITGDDRLGGWWNQVRIRREGEAEASLPILPDQWLPPGRLMFLPESQPNEDGSTTIAEIESDSRRIPVTVRSALDQELLQASVRDLPTTQPDTEVAVQAWIYVMGNNAPERIMKLPVSAARDLVGPPENAVGWPELNVTPGIPKSWSRMIIGESIDVTATLGADGVHVAGTLSVPMLGLKYDSAAEAIHQNFAEKNRNASRKLLQTKFAATLGQNHALVIPILSQGLFPEALVAILTAVPHSKSPAPWLAVNSRPAIQFDGWVLTWPRSEHQWFTSLYDYKRVPNTVADLIEARRAATTEVLGAEFVGFMNEEEVNGLLARFRGRAGVNLEPIDPFTVALANRGNTGRLHQADFSADGEQGVMQVRARGEHISPNWSWKSPQRSYREPAIGVKSGQWFSALLPGPANPDKIRMMILRCVDPAAVTKKSPSVQQKGASSR
ncbi:MAG: serine/threonine protein kinase [Verrucomicrobiaceae bacterium]|nr:serine/threonine protein kinase [Verrucomicrobiaceae bacterium]